MSPWSRLNGTFRALRNEGFRLYFSCQVISMSGTWLQTTAQSWVIWRLTHSAWWVGAIAFCSQFTSFLTCPFAGVFAEHHDRRRTLFWMQVVCLLEAVTLGLLTMSGHITIFWLAGLATILGFVNAFELTTRHAFSIDIAGRGDLSSAIALNSVAINGSRVIGPAVAGIMIRAVGEAWCFLLNGASYLFTMYALMKVEVRPAHHKLDHRTNPMTEFAEALAYIRRTPDINRLLVLATLISFAGFPYSVLMPSFATEVLHGDSRTLAWLVASSGVGAVAGALLSGTPTRAFTLPRNTALIGVSLLGLSLSRSPVSSSIAMACLGFTLMGAFPRINSLVQHRVQDSMRGRVLSVYNMTFLGTMPVGSLLAGAFADRYGAPAVAAAMGSWFVLAGGALTVRALRMRASAAPLAS